MPEEKPKEKPKELPKTASPMELLGLIGLASMSGGYLIRFFRR
jgi:LPXTG-motif cell wall-anchored protein